MDQHTARREQVVSTLLNEMERAALEGEDEHLQAVTDAYAAISEGMALDAAMERAAADDMESPETPVTTKQGSSISAPSLTNTAWAKGTAPQKDLESPWRQSG